MVALLKKKRPQGAAAEQTQDESIRRDHKLVAQGISKTFIDPKGREVQALKDFSHDLEGNHVVAIVGPSGCGKTTFLRLIAGLDFPDSGELMLDGEPITEPHYNRGLLFQDAALYDWLTVFENIAFGLRARKVFEGKEEKVHEYIKMMGLEGFEHSYPYQLSGGMAARVALARTFIQNPDVILLDEPLSALDAFTRATLQDEIVRMHLNSDALFILVTHDIEEAVYLSDKVIVMSPRPGRIIGEIDIDLPHPRDRVSPEFVEKRREIMVYFDTMFEQTGG